MRYTCSHFVGFILLIFFIISSGTNGWCADNTPATERITIEADRMESLQKKNIVLFIGHVAAKQGDLVIHGDEMTIFYSSAAPQPGTSGNSSQNIEKLVAKGNVELKKQGWTASGDAVDYFADQRKVVLTGNTKVLQNNNMITGERIVLSLDDGKSIVESTPGNGERVKAIITPGNGNNLPAKEQ